MPGNCKVDLDAHALDINARLGMLPFMDKVESDAVRRWMMACAAADFKAVLAHASPEEFQRFFEEQSREKARNIRHTIRLVILLLLWTAAIFLVIFKCNTLGRALIVPPMIFVFMFCFSLFVVPRTFSQNALQVLCKTDYAKSHGITPQNLTLWNKRALLRLFTCVSLLFPLPFIPFLFLMLLLPDGYLFLVIALPMLLLAWMPKRIFYNWFLTKFLPFATKTNYEQIQTHPH